jgi:3-hydroxybutyryl-CoA dehydrogenase
MIQTICICGAGTMGHGIAQVAAASGFRTLLYDLNPGPLQKAGMSIEKNLQRDVENNRISPETKKEIQERLYFVSEIRDCKADLIIEAIVEKLDVKMDLFSRLAEINGKNTLLTTNTSSLSVNAIAEKIIRPERFAGMHFFNPAPVMKLVEVVRTKNCGEENIQIICELAKRMGKTPVICKDAPGFIVNHVARPYYLESLFLVEAGFCEMESIDRLLESSGFKMGPFRLMDLIGNDINYQVSRSIYEAMNKPERLKPSSIQKDKVDKGELGRKTGRGYYEYQKQ